MWGDISLWFWLAISLMISDIQYLFICILAVYFLWENAYSDPLPIFNRIFCCFVMKLCELFIYFVCKHLIGYVICKYFSPIQQVDFAFCWWLPLPSRIWLSPTWFMFVVVLFFLLLVFAFAFSVKFKKSSPRLRSGCLVPMFSSRIFMVSSVTFKS